MTAAFPLSIRAMCQHQLHTHVSTVQIILVTCCDLEMIPNIASSEGGLCKEQLIHAVPVGALLSPLSHLAATASC